MSHTEKSTKAEYNARVGKVLDLLVGGASRAQIIQYGSEKSEPRWNVSDRQIDKYIRSANILLEKESAYHRPRELGRAIKRLNNLYARCMQIQDFKGALAVQKELNELLGTKAQADGGGAERQKLIIEFAQPGMVTGATKMEEMP